MSVAVSLGEALGISFREKRWDRLAPLPSSTSATCAITGVSSSIIDLALLLGWSRRQSEVERVTLRVSRDWAAGYISDADYQAFLEAAERRRADIRSNANLHQARYGAPRRYVYDRTASKDKRRDLVRLGAVPHWLANRLTPGEEAVAAVILQDIGHHGYCDKFNGDIAALAGCCERLVIRTKARLAEMEEIRIARRRRLRCRSDSTILTAASPELQLWLRDRHPRSQLGERPCCVHQGKDIQRLKRIADEENEIPHACDRRANQAVLSRCSGIDRLSPQSAQITPRVARTA
jgi:hypothetical protein